jgi:hypothetical protein
MFVCSHFLVREGDCLVNQADLHGAIPDVSWYPIGEVPRLGVLKECSLSVEIIQDEFVMSEWMVDCGDR